MKHAARVMKAQRSGVIVSTASIAGLSGGRGALAYGAAKAGVLSLTRHAAAELGAWGVRVVAVVPGPIATPMTAQLLVSDPDAVEETEKLMARSASPLSGRAGVAADVANAVVWLASDAAGFISGHGLVIDAGITTGSQPPGGLMRMLPGER